MKIALDEKPIIKVLKPDSINIIGYQENHSFICDKDKAFMTCKKCEWFYYCSEECLNID